MDVFFVSWRHVRGGGKRNGVRLERFGASGLAAAAAAAKNVEHLGRPSAKRLFAGFKPNRPKNRQRFEDFLLLAECNNHGRPSAPA